MAKNEEVLKLEATALELTRTQTTEQLIAAFEQTDKILTSLAEDFERRGTTRQPATLERQYAEVTTARQWIIEVLDERGEILKLWGGFDG